MIVVRKELQVFCDRREQGKGGVPSVGTHLFSVQVHLFWHERFMVVMWRTLVSIFPNRCYLSHLFHHHSVNICMYDFLIQHLDLEKSRSSVIDWLHTCLAETTTFHVTTDDPMRFSGVDLDNSILFHLMNDFLTWRPAIRVSAPSA